MASAYKVVTVELLSPYVSGSGAWQPGKEIICDDDRAGSGLYVWSQLGSARGYAQAERRGPAGAWRDNGPRIVELSYDEPDIVRRGSRPDGANEHLVLRRCTVVGEIPG